MRTSCCAPFRRRSSSAERRSVSELRQVRAARVQGRCGCVPSSGTGDRHHPQALAWRLLDVTESNGTPVDLVIATKFPSFLVRHRARWRGSSISTGRRTTVRHAVLLFQDNPIHPDRAASTVGHALPLGVSAPLHHLAHRRQRLRSTTPWRPSRSIAATAARALSHDRCGDYCSTWDDSTVSSGLDLALDAMSRVQSDARLKIAGVGPMADELRKQIARLGLEQRVQLLGFVSADDLIASTRDVAPRTTPR